MPEPVVLIVDDDPHDLKFAADALTSGGYAVVTAPDGKTAYASMRNSPPSVLVTEVLLPEMDGIELITALRRAHTSLPILATSGRLRFGTLSLLELASHVGASATLPKPFTANELVEQVASLLGREASAAD